MLRRYKIVKTKHFNGTEEYDLYAIPGLYNTLYGTLFNAWIKVNYMPLTLEEAKRLYKDRIETYYRDKKTRKQRKPKITTLRHKELMKDVDG